MPSVSAKKGGLVSHLLYNARFAQLDIDYYESLSRKFVTENSTIIKTSLHDNYDNEIQYYSTILKKWC